jgi:hypothetical protein
MSNPSTYILLNNVGTQDNILMASDLLHKRLKQIKEQKINEKLQDKFNELQILYTALENIQDNINTIRLKNGYNKEDMEYINDMNVPDSSASDKERKLYNKLQNNSNTNVDWKYYIQQKQKLLINIDIVNKNIEKEKQSNLGNNGNSLVSMTDIEKSHINFMSKQFKPFVEIGFGYINQEPTGGSLGFDQTMRFRMLNQGEYIHDQVLHLRLEGLSNINPLDRVRYCDFIGHRIMEKVTFSINITPIDEYTSERYNNYYNF